MKKGIEKPQKNEDVGKPWQVEVQEFDATDEDEQPKGFGSRRKTPTFEIRGFVFVVVGDRVRPKYLGTNFGIAIWNRIPNTMVRITRQIRNAIMRVLELWSKRQTKKTGSSSSDFPVRR